jgi:predicted DNA-binding transcriptional regulator AlpA
MHHNKDHIRSEWVTQAASDLVKSSQHQRHSQANLKRKYIKSKLNFLSPVRYERYDSQELPNRVKRGKHSTALR